ncbi:MAG: methionyl-tRNA formyltransferase [Planctomycetes bacterium]|nr:methionyl-tRNA formyltransferase [Planctomycetota bacterium]
MRFAFFGSDVFALPTLVALASAGHEPVLVLTNPDRRRGRSKTLLATPIKEEAIRREVPVLQPAGRPGREEAAAIADSGAELGVVVAYGQFLTKRVRQAPSLGYSINLHGSLLPRWRGAAPVAYAIRAGDEATGVSVQKVEKAMDAGDVFAAREEPIGPSDTRGELRDRLSALGASLIVDVVNEIANGAAQAAPQDTSQITLATKLSKEDSLLSLEASAIELDRTIRAFTPWPGGRLELESGPLGLLRVRPLDVPETDAAPGTLLDLSAEGIVIATGSGALELLEVKPAGKRGMSGRAYANGRRLARGDTL